MFIRASAKESVLEERSERNKEQKKKKKSLRVKKGNQKTQKDRER